MKTRLKGLSATLFLLVVSLFVLRCGQDICVAGIGQCSTAGLPANGSSGSSTNTLQINASTWPRQIGHVVVYNSTVAGSGILNVIVTGGNQPYQAPQMYNCSSSTTCGTAPTLTAGAAGFTGTYTAPTTATPFVVIMVQDSSNPVQTAYLPLTIDPN